MRKCLVLACLFSVALIGTSCSTVKEEGKDAIVAAATPIVAKYGDCANSEAIKKSLDEKVSAWFKIQENEGTMKSLSVGSTVCQVALSAILPALINFGGSKLPSEWECKLTTVQGTALSLAQEACAKL
ncbi:hypothetical protein MASR1M48_16370 [Lactococcus petauri]